MNVTIQEYDRLQLEFERQRLELQRARAELQRARSASYSPTRHANEGETAVAQANELMKPPYPKPVPHDEAFFEPGALLPSRAAPHYVTCHATGRVDIEDHDHHRQGWPDDLHEHCASLKGVLRAEGVLGESFVPASEEASEGSEAAEAEWEYLSVEEVVEVSVTASDDGAGRNPCVPCVRVCC